MKINNLEEGINKLKKENEYLKEVCNELRMRIDRIENDKLYKKYIIAIQDINGKWKLEQDKSITHVLLKLKANRVDECHYINEKDYENYKDESYVDSYHNKQIIILKNKIMNMPHIIRDKINKYYPNLLDTIILHIDHKVNNIDLTNDEDTEYINDWWD